MKREKIAKLCLKDVKIAVARLKKVKIAVERLCDVEVFCERCNTITYVQAIPYVCSTNTEY